MVEVSRPAYYAAAPGRWRDWWTLLHPPYTAWHLSYVVLGACLAAQPGVTNLVVSVVAFFFALGLAAHALDELNGRPLATGIPDGWLRAVAVLGVAVAVGLGVAGVVRVGPWLVVCIVAGCLLVVGYNLELFGGRLHTDGWFAFAWGAFPVLVGCVAQHDRITVAAVLAALGAFGLARAQRALSTPARLLRRRTRSVAGTLVGVDGASVPLDRSVLLAPLEVALKAMSWSVVAVAAGIAVARLR